MKYSFITQHKKTWPVALMCRTLGVKSNNYYSHQKRLRTKPNNNSTHQEMLDWVKFVAKFSDYTYGSRRIKRVLNALSFPVSRSKAGKLMREAGVWVRYKKKYTCDTSRCRIESLKIIIDPSIETVTNFRHYLFEKVINSLSKLFCCSKIFIISNSFIHHFPKPLYRV